MTFYTIKKGKNLMHELEQKIQSNDETEFSSHLADPNYGAERTNSLLFFKERLWYVLIVKCVQSV